MICGTAVEKDTETRALAMTDLLEKEVGFTIHPRSIEQAPEERKKRRSIDESE